MSDATTALAEVLAEAADENQSASWHDLAAAVVAAVRGLSPDLQAELIGGEVQRRLAAEDMHSPTWTEHRVVTPWTPEQTEETA